MSPDNESHIMAPRSNSKSRGRTARDDRGDTNEDADDEDPIHNSMDLVTVFKLPPTQFRDEKWARDNIDSISEYAEYKVAGWSPEQAFCRVFGTDYADWYLEARINALEHNLVFRKVFAQKFAAAKADDQWSVKASIFELQRLINSQFTKDSTKLAAIKELNVMFGITVVDENGKTRQGSALQDFYKGLQKPVTGEVGAKHPEPGSPEAEAFMADRDARIAAGRDK